VEKRKNWGFFFHEGKKENLGQKKRRRGGTRRKKEAAAFIPKHRGKDFWQSGGREGETSSVGAKNACDVGGSD